MRGGATTGGRSGNAVRGGANAAGRTADPRRGGAGGGRGQSAVRPAGDSATRDGGRGSEAGKPIGRDGRGDPYRFDDRGGQGDRHRDYRRGGYHDDGYGHYKHHGKYHHNNNGWDWGCGWSFGFGYWGWGGWGFWGGWGGGWGGYWGGWYGGYGGYWGYPGYYYPVYRVYDYYPWSYYGVVAAYPVYAYPYHTTYAAVGYVDSGDPYVEYVDPVPDAVVAAPPIPAEFLVPIASSGVPAGLDDVALVSFSQSAMKAGDYVNAAEAARQVWVLNPADARAAEMVGLALVGAGSYELGSKAITEALVRGANRVTDPTDVVAVFPVRDAFDVALAGLKRFAVANPNAGDVYFALGYLQLASGDAFGAHATFLSLQEGGFENPLLADLLEAARVAALGG